MGDSKYHFRTIFTARLVQLTSLSVGGTVGLSDCDAPLATDGQGRFIMRGTSLAGALVAALRKLGYEVPAYISGSKQGDRQSRWLVHNLHLSNPFKTRPELRQMVAIDSKTRGAKEGALFDVETLPRHTDWKLFIEADVRDDDEGREAERLLAAVLKRWNDHYGQIGAHAARGMGFFKLKDPKCFRVHVSSGSCSWPDTAVDDPWVWFRDSNRKDASIAQTHLKVIEEPNTPCDKPAHTVEVTADIVAGRSESGYGIDGLSIGSHEATRYEAGLDASFLAPAGMRDTEWLKNETDMYPAVTREAKDGAGFTPFIPGSSLRGALRHAVERMAAPGCDAALMSKLFGYVDEANKTAQDGALVVWDAYLDGTNPKGAAGHRLALIQQHAEDEFTAGVYGSSKFDRVLLIEGRFPIRLIIETSPGEGEGTLVSYLSCLMPALRAATNGHLDLGGAAFRGSGWVRWKEISIKMGPFGKSLEKKMDLEQLDRWLKEAGNGAQQS